MKIYYIGQLSEGSTCRERMYTLQSLGHQIIPFDTIPWLNGGARIIRALAHRANFGPRVWGLNKALLCHARSVGTVDLIWIDKGQWISRDTLVQIRNQTGALLIHYTPDSHFFDNQSYQFHDAIIEYDIVVTTKRFELAHYEQRRARNVVLILQGYDPRFESYRRCSNNRQKWSSDVAFVGHSQPHYARTLKVVGGDLAIWGPRWLRYARFNRWARAHVRGNGVWGNDYLNALAYTKIALGLLGKHIPETTTTRTFEIPALGTFLLAERNDEHITLFQEGVEAEFFASNEELQDKVQYYLRNESARQQIAAAGRRRVLRSGYSNRHQLLKVLAEIDLLRR